MSRVVGITGGIACGKSTCGAVLESLGVPVLDTDHVAHDVIRRGKPAYDDLLQKFGKEILGADEEIDRKRLGKIVFEDKKKLETLNAIVHPQVSLAWRGWRDERRSQGSHAAIMIPLLFEVGATDGWDAILCIASEEAFVRERMGGRGLNPQEIDQRLSAQMSIEQKADRSDFVIWNNHSQQQFENQVIEWWQNFVN